MAKREKLTDTQAEALKFIREQVKERGFPPSRREISTRLGFASANAAEYVLRALERKRFVSIEPGTPRGIKIL